MTTPTNEAWIERFTHEFGIHFSPSELQFALAFISALLEEREQLNSL